MVEKPGDIEKGVSARNKRRLKEWRLKCYAVQVRANNIIESLPHFSFQQFERKLYKSEQTARKVFDYYTDIINKKRYNAKLGTGFAAYRVQPG